MLLSFRYQKVISNDDWSLQSNCIHVHMYMCLVYDLVDTCKTSQKLGTIKFIVHVHVHVFIITTCTCTLYLLMYKVHVHVHV